MNPGKNNHLFLSSCLALGDSGEPRSWVCGMACRSQADPLTGWGWALPESQEIVYFVAGQVSGPGERMWAQEEQDKAGVGGVGVLL